MDQGCGHQAENGGRTMSTQKTLETLLKEQLNHTVELSLLERKKDFRLAELFVHLLEIVLIGGFPKGSLKRFRDAINEEFPDWNESLVLNGITVEQVERQTQLHYLLE